MKRSRLFLLLACLLFSALGLSACFGPIGTPSDTTGGSVTTTLPNEGSTTTAPTTTAPLTTAPPVDTYLGIASFLNTKKNGILLIYADNTTQKLGFPTIELRDGYNTCEVTDLEVNDGILSLTMSDASVNIALTLLGQTKSGVTVELTGLNGNLCYRVVPGEAWIPLAPFSAEKVEGDSLIEALQAALGIGAHPEELGEGTIFAINGNLLRFRATEWTETHDLAMDAKLRNDGSNHNFNIMSLNLVSKTTANDDVSTKTELFKSASDDICPLNFNGTYIGANHGYYIIAATQCVGHGKTEADIGSVWKLNSQKFVLVKVDGSTLWFCPADDAAMNSGRFNYTKISAGNVLVHVSGAKNQSSVTASADSVQTQFYTATNHLVQRAYLNGVVEVDLSERGSYECEFIDFYEAYDIIYLPDMLNYLIQNVGYNDNDSHHDEEIEGAYARIHVTYRYHQNGACVIYSQYDFHKNVGVHYFGAVQSQPFSESTHYVYVPGTADYNVPTLQDGASIYITQNSLATDGKHITSYFQMSDANGTKVMNLGYNPDYGYGTSALRTEKLLGDYGFYYTSYKMYPYLISSCQVAAGESITSVAYRVPSVKYDEDFTVVNWYWVGDDIYLSLHTDKALDKTVVLPDYMEGMTVTLVESDGSAFTVNSSEIDGGISVTSSGAGYAIVKLSPAD